MYSKMQIEKHLITNCKFILLKNIFFEYAWRVCEKGEQTCQNLI